MKKILTLDGLRGPAALLIAIYHFDIGSDFNTILTRDSYMLVDLFFILSGFFMAYCHADFVITVRNILKFQVKRLKRFLPLHYFVLLLFVALECVNLLTTSIFHRPLGGAPFGGVHTFEMLLPNLFLVQIFVFPLPSWNGPSWYLCFLFYGYFYFFLMRLLAGHKRLYLTVLALVVALSCFGLINLGFRADRASGALRFFAGFSLGMLLCDFYRAWPGRCGDGAFVVALGLSGASVLIPAEAYPALQFLSLFGFALLVWVTARLEACWSARLLRCQPLRFLAKISFVIFMLNYFFAIFVPDLLQFIWQLPPRAPLAVMVSALTQNRFLIDAGMVLYLLFLVWICHLVRQLLSRLQRPAPPEAAGPSGPTGREAYKHPAQINIRSTSSKVISSARRS